MGDGKHGVQHLGRKHVAISTTLLYTIPIDFWHSSADLGKPMLEYGLSLTKRDNRYSFAFGVYQGV